MVALFSAGSSGLVGITALILNYRGFASIDARFGSLESRLLATENRFDARFASIERRLDTMQQDIKDLNKAMSALEVDVALVKDKSDCKRLDRELRAGVPAMRRARLNSPGHMPGAVQAANLNAM